MSPPKHKTSEDPFPQRAPGTFRLYSMQYCPYALRARLMLAKKGVKCEIININLRNKPQWFLEKYPVGTVPVMETDEGVLGGSLVVANYVDEVYSKDGDRTLPTEPFQKGKTNMLIDDKFTKAISSVYQRLGQKENWQEGFFKNVGELEKELESKKFFTGDKISFADYMVWPWMRLIGPVIDDVLPTGKFPNLERWIQDMSKDDTIKKCHTSPEILQKFVNGFIAKNFVYDLE